jgi:hypothetical protein
MVELTEAGAARLLVWCQVECRKGPVVSGRRARCRNSKASSLTQLRGSMEALVDPAWFGIWPRLFPPHSKTPGLFVFCAFSAPLRQSRHAAGDCLTGHGQTDFVHLLSGLASNCVPCSLPVGKLRDAGPCGRGYCGHGHLGSPIVVWLYIHTYAGRPPCPFPCGQPTGPSIFACSVSHPPLVITGSLFVLSAEELVGMGKQTKGPAWPCQPTMARLPSFPRRPWPSVNQDSGFSGGLVGPQGPSPSPSLAGVISHPGSDE